METYQGKALDLHLGTALNRGVKVEEDSMGREPEEGAGNGHSAVLSGRRKQSLEATPPAPMGLATPMGLKEQWDAQWQQFLKTMEAPKLKVGNSDAPAGTCHSWTVFSVAEGACSASPAQQREIVPQVPFGSSEEARGPPGRMAANRIVKQICRTAREESVQFPQAKQSGLTPGPDLLLKNIKEEEEENYILIEDDGKAAVEELQQRDSSRPVKLPRRSFGKIPRSLIQKFSSPEKRTANCPYPLRTYENRGKSKAFQTVPKQPQDLERWEPPTRRTLHEESAQTLEVEPDGSEPAGQELLFNEITQDGHCVLIGEDGKATVEELHQPDMVIEMESSGQTFRGAQRGGSWSRPLNNPEKKEEDKSSYALRTYEKRLKSNDFQTATIQQQETERWEPPAFRTFGEESAPFSEGQPAESEQEEQEEQELLFNEVAPDGRCVLIGEDGRTTVEEPQEAEMVIEVESSAEPFGEVQPLNGPEKRRDRTSNCLRTYEKRVKSKAFQTVAIPEQEPERWESPARKVSHEASDQSPEAEPDGSEQAGQELLFNEITHNGHCVLIGEDGKATVEELQQPYVVIEVESSGQTFRGAQRGGAWSRPLNGPEKKKKEDKSSYALRTYEKRLKSNAFQTAAIQQQEAERWEPPMPSSVREESAQSPEAKQAGSEARQELLCKEIKQEENYVLIGEDGNVEEMRQSETVAAEAQSSGQASGEARLAGERSRRKPPKGPGKIRDSYPLRTYEKRAKSQAFPAAAIRQQEPERWEPPRRRNVSEESAQSPEAKQAGSEAGQELLRKEIKQEGNYVLIGEDGNTSVEELRQPEIVIEVPSAWQLFRDDKRGDEVSLRPKWNGSERRRDGSSSSLRISERKVKSEAFEMDLRPQREPERLAAPVRRRFREESAQFPDRKQLPFREIKQEENYVLIAGDGRTYTEPQPRPESFIEVELSRQLFGEDQCDDEASHSPSRKKKAKSRVFRTGPADGDGRGESECRRMFRKELDLATDEEASSGENPCRRSGFGEAPPLSAPPLRLRGRRKPHACSECGKGFLYRSILFAHRRVHLGERPAQCSECGKTFGRPEGLSAHRQRAHAGERPYGCPVCRKRFGLLEDLADHKWVHTGGNPYRSAEGRYARRRAHASEMPYVCSHCGKRFGKTRELLAHQKIHAGAKPHECSYCGRCFMYRSIFLAHQRLHTEETPHRCLECGKTFSVQRNLLTHRRRIHQTGDPCAGSPSAGVKISPDANGSKGS